MQIEYLSNGLLFESYLDYCHPCKLALIRFFDESSRTFLLLLSSFLLKSCFSSSFPTEVKLTFKCSNLRYRSYGWRKWKRLREQYAHLLARCCDEYSKTKTANITENKDKQYMLTSNSKFTEFSQFSSKLLKPLLTSIYC